MDILAIIIHGIEYNPISYPADLFIIFFCSQNSLKCVIMEQWPALQNKLKIYVEQDIFMHVLAGALQMKRIGNRLEIWIEYVCFSLNCIAFVGTIYISYLNGYFGDGRPTGEQGSRLPLLHFQINLDQFWNNVNWTFYNGVAK